MWPARGTLAAWAAGVLAGCPVGEGGVDGGDVDGGGEIAVVSVDGNALDEDGAPVLGTFLPDAVSPGVEVFPLQGLRLDDDGRSAEISVKLESDTASVSVAVLSANGETVGVAFAADDDAVLVDDAPATAFEPADVAAAGGVPGPFFAESRAIAGVDVGAALIPSSDAVELTGSRVRLRVGEWRVRDAAGEVSVAPGTGPLSAVVVRKRAVASSRARLRLVVHLALDGVAAEDFGQDAQLTEAFDHLVEVYAAAGIDVVVDTVEDVTDPGFRVIELEDDVCVRGELSRLLADETAGGAGNALHVFVVERFSCLFAGAEVGASFGGFTGHIPVPAPLVGTSASGLAVARAPFADQPERLGLVLAHEIGHALGLFHTQEDLAVGADAIFDPVHDTSTFEPGENLMFYLVDGSAALTEGQARVMRRHPLVEDVELGQ